MADPRQTPRERREHDERRARDERPEDLPPEERAEEPSPEELTGRSEHSTTEAHPDEEPSGVDVTPPPRRERLSTQPEERAARALDEATQNDPSTIGEEDEDPPAEEEAIHPESP